MIMSDATVVGLWINSVHLRVFSSRTQNTTFHALPRDGTHEQSIPATELLASLTRFEPMIWGLESQHAANQATKVPLRPCMSNNRSHLFCWLSLYFSFLPFFTIASFKADVPLIHKKHERESVSNTVRHTMAGHGTRFSQTLGAF